MQLKTPDTTPVYVFGHRNPDTDSICSAIAYANLKQACGHQNVIPGRLGKINKETQFVLNTFGVEEPEMIGEIRPQVSDLPLEEYPHILETDSVRHALKKIIQAPGRSIPVTNDEGKLTGIISLADIISVIIESFYPGLLKENKTLFYNVIVQLNAGKIGEPAGPIVTGNVYVHTEFSALPKLDPEDILVTSINDSKYLQAFQSGSKNIIIANVPASCEFHQPEDFDGLILLCEFPPYEVMHRLTQVIPVTNYVQRKDLEYFVTYETIEDVKKNILTSTHRRFPVVDEDGYMISTISKSSLLDYHKKPVILVDHNERSQSAKGISEAEIIEVIDHHRIAEIQTATPLFLRMEPVGCTSTIVAKMYREKNVPISKTMAGLMLSAILSDTLIFNSPTCTREDKRIAEELAKIAEVDPEKYGRELIIAGSNLTEMTPSEILNADRKHFSLGRYQVVISQINTGDFKGIVTQLNPVLEQMRADCTEKNYDLAVLMVTDVILGGTELIVEGKAHQLAEMAFGMPKKECTRYMPGVFSRKKQIVPPLMNAASMIE